MQIAARIHKMPIFVACYGMQCAIAQQSHVIDVHLLPQKISIVAIKYYMYAVSVLGWSHTITVIKPNSY